MGGTGMSAWSDSVDEYVRRMNSLEVRTAPAPLFTEGTYSMPLVRRRVTDDVIAQFARAAGDTNPLWTDPGYAGATTWGTVIAPPIFEACLSEGASSPIPPQIEGWNALQAGSVRRYRRPFRPGDEIHAEDTWHGIEEKTRPGRPYRLFIQTCERRYLNQNDELVATLVNRVASTATPPGNGSGPQGPDLGDRRRRRLTDDELAAIRRSYEQELSGEARRGAEPRFWEDVTVGDVLPEVLKGPYDITDAAAFAGAVAVCSGFAAKWQEFAGDRDRHTPDPETGALHHPIEWHFSDAIARTRGLPSAHAFGTHMEMMLVHPVTNWMSDLGVIVEIDAKLQSVLLIGEVSRTSGRVVDKRVDGDAHLVVLDMASQTLDGVDYARAKVTVCLPRSSA
jgi:acyl dehydratase